MLLILAHRYGARLTGGGWGGSCFALTDDSFTENNAELVCTAYYDRFKNQCKFYNVSAAQGAFIHNDDDVNDTYHKVQRMHHAQQQSAPVAQVSPE